jgi:hypothetical protein
MLESDYELFFIDLDCEWNLSTRNYELIMNILLRLR